MTALFSVRSKYKVALSLLMLIIILLCGVLLERSFFSRVDEASTSIYNDRLIPSTAVFYISDHITQRLFILKEYVGKYPAKSLRSKHLLSIHAQQTDSIITAFEETYLVKGERNSLEELKMHLAVHYNLEQEVLATGEPKKLQQCEQLYDNIRVELMNLSRIQTHVGQELLNEAHSITSNAGLISHIQVVALIITCLVIQAFILASKAISSPLKQRHSLN